MAFTLDQLTALDAAIATGSLEVKYADKQVTYRSLAEMLRIRALMATELGLVSTSRNRIYGEFHSGLTEGSSDNTHFD